MIQDVRAHNELIMIEHNRACPIRGDLFDEYDRDICEHVEEHNFDQAIGARGNESIAQSCAFTLVAVKSLRAQYSNPPVVNELGRNVLKRIASQACRTGLNCFDVTLRAIVKRNLYNKHSHGLTFGKFSSSPGNTLKLTPFCKMG